MRQWRWAENCSIATARLRDASAARASVPCTAMRRVDGGALHVERDRRGLADHPAIGVAHRRADGWVAALGSRHLDSSHRRSSVGSSASTIDRHRELVARPAAPARAAPATGTESGANNDASAAGCADRAGLVGLGLAVARSCARRRRRFRCCRARAARDRFGAGDLDHLRTRLRRVGIVHDALGIDPAIERRAPRCHAAAASEPDSTASRHMNAVDSHCAQA